MDEQGSGAVTMVPSRYEPPELRHSEQVRLILAGVPRPGPRRPVAERPEDAPDEVPSVAAGPTKRRRPRARRILLLVLVALLLAAAAVTVAGGLRHHDPAATWRAGITAVLHFLRHVHR